MSNSLLKELFGDSVPEPQKPIVLQRSELGRWGTCPMQGHLAEVHDAELNRHEVLPETGTIVHSIAEQAIKWCDYNLQDASGMINQELPKARPDLQPEVLRAGKNLARELQRFGTNQVLLCEEPVTRSLLPATNARGEVLIVAEPDLVLGTNDVDVIHVIDYKSGHKQRTNQEARDDFQTTTLAFVLAGKYPQLKTIHFWYIETRTFTKAYARIDLNKEVLRYTDEETGEVEVETEHDCIHARLLQAYSTRQDYVDMEERDIPVWPEPGKCGMCCALRWCGGADRWQSEFIADQRSYLDDYIICKAVCDEMRKTMNAFVKEGNVIYGTDPLVRYGFEPSRPKFMPKVIKNKVKK